MVVLVLWAAGGHPEALFTSVRYQLLCEACFVELTSLRLVALDDIKPMTRIVQLQKAAVVAGLTELQCRLNCVCARHWSRNAAPAGV